MRKSSIEWDYETDELSAEGTVEYTYIPGSEGLYAFPNGDPGYPPDPPEVEFYGHKLTQLIIAGQDITKLIQSKNHEIALDLFGYVEDRMYYRVLECCNEGDE